MRRMGPDRHQKRACAGKLKYQTLNEAEMEIERAATYRSEVLRAYRCDHCNAFHLSSKPKREDYAK